MTETGLPPSSDPAVDSGVDPDDQPAEGFLMPGEAARERAEKLAAIRSAVARGKYDDPKLLDQALLKMLERLDSGEDLDHDDSSKSRD